MFRGTSLVHSPVATRKTVQEGAAILVKGLVSANQKVASPLDDKQTAPSAVDEAGTSTMPNPQVDLLSANGVMIPASTTDSDVATGTGNPTATASEAGSKQHAGLTVELLADMLAQQEQKFNQLADFCGQIVMDHDQLAAKVEQQEERLSGFEKLSDLMAARQRSRPVQSSSSLTSGAASLTGRTQLAQAISSLQGVTNASIAKDLPEVEAKAATFMEQGIPSALSCGEPRLQDKPYLVEHFADHLFTRVNNMGKLVLMEGGELGIDDSPVNLPTSVTPASGKALLKKLPHVMAFQRYELVYRKSMQAAGFLVGKDLVDYQVFVAQLISTAESFVGLGDDAWLLFLQYQQDLYRFHFEQNSKLLTEGLGATFSWATQSGFLDMGKYMKYQAKLLQLQQQQRQQFGGGSVAGGARVSRRPGAVSKQSGFLDYGAVLRSLPAAVNAEEVCVPFWARGKCTRPQCRMAGTGHKCLLCGSLNHGGANCPGPAAPGAQA